MSNNVAALTGMWFKDFGEERDTETHPEPTPSQLLHEEAAMHQARVLKSCLERLTVPQQRRVIATVSGGIFRRVAPAGYTVDEWLDELEERSK